LRSRQSRFLFPLVMKIVHHLCRTQGGTIISRLRNESFHNEIVPILSSKDIFSFLCLACCNPTVKGVLADVHRAVQGAAYSLKGLAELVETIFL
jgi:hypothetical protein